LDAVLHRSKPTLRRSSATSKGAAMSEYPPIAARPTSPTRAPGHPIGVSMWQIARSADAIIGAIGASNGTWSNRTSGGAAAAAAAFTRDSGNQSPTATTDSERGGGTSRSARALPVTPGGAMAPGTAA
jgi:hypothetical protein